MSMDITQFLQTFFEESFEGLEIMETSLLNLDTGTADSEVINTIFRAAHSIKGGSGTFGLNDVASFTHVMETLLDQMRSGERQVTDTAVDLLLEGVDRLKEMLSALQDKSTIDAESVADTHVKLEKLLKEKEITDIPQCPPPQNNGGGSNNNESNTGPISGNWKITFNPHENLLRTGNDPVRIIKELATLGELTVKANTSAIPVLPDIVPESSYLLWEINLKGHISKDHITEVFEWVDDECDLDIDFTPDKTVTDNQPTAATVQQEPDMKSAKSSSNSGSQKPAVGDNTSIRVGTDKVDDLINMVGELVITQSMLSQLSEYTDSKSIEKMHDGLAQLERNTRELQESVMRIRMLPISFAFNRFPRMVRDISGKLNKKINFVTTGEQTELDKGVMEKIGDPLVHLVRNSLDHGIETPEVRAANGKPETGTVELNAYHQGSNIVIEIKDDGAGINKEKVLAKAISNGIIQDKEEITDEKIYSLIFEAGFSTAEVITDVSGRGVGMDVVKRNIKELGGTIDLASNPGIGSTFTIRLPLTLAILDGQLIRVGDNTFILPLVSIIESLQITTGSVSSIAGKAELYKLRDDYIPIIRMCDLFNIEGANRELTNGLLVVVEGDGQKAGLLVDDLLNQQQVVIKSLESNFRKIEGVSGATILGDGTVALILDTGGLIKFSQTQANYTGTNNNRAA